MPLPRSQLRSGAGMWPMTTTRSTCILSASPGGIVPCCGLTARRNVGSSGSSTHSGSHVGSAGGSCGVEWSRYQQHRQQEQWRQWSQQQHRGMAEACTTWAVSAQTAAVAMLGDSDGNEAASRSSGGSVVSTRGTTQKDDDANNTINELSQSRDSGLVWGELWWFRPEGGGGGCLGNDH
jgi:hypothetical protein